MHVTSQAIESAEHGLENSPRSLTSTRITESHEPCPDDILMSMLHGSGNDNWQLMQGNDSCNPSNGWLAHSILKMFHKGNCHMTTFANHTGYTWRASFIQTRRIPGTILIAEAHLLTSLQDYATQNVAGLIHIACIIHIVILNSGAISWGLMDGLQQNLQCHNGMQPVQQAQHCPMPPRSLRRAPQQLNCLSKASGLSCTWMPQKNCPSIPVCIRMVGAAIRTLDLQARLIGGGPSGSLSSSELSQHIWPRSGTQQANEVHMHCALRSIETRAFEQGHLSDSFMSNGSNYPSPHDCLVSNLLAFAGQEQQILSGDNHGISHTSRYLMKVMHEGKCHMLIFSDQVHWRVILLDGRTKVAYCAEPYGNAGPVSFSSSQPQQVLQALRVMLSERAGWKVQVTCNPWQQSNDGHSCGMWVIWICEKFMHFVATCATDSDFQTWATRERPCQKDLRSRYHDMYNEQQGLGQEVGPGDRLPVKRGNVKLPGKKPCKRGHDLHQTEQPVIFEQTVTVTPAHGGPAISLLAEQGALVPQRAQARGLGQESRSDKSRKRTTLKQSREEAPARLTVPLKRQARCNKLPRAMKATAKLAPPQPVRSAQLTAALGKSWTQAKLSFGKAVQSSNCQTSSRLPLAKEISAAEVKSETCSPIAANLPAAPVPIVSVPSKELHLEGSQPGDTLTV